MQSRTLPSNFNYDQQQPYLGESFGHTEHTSLESVPKIERISPDNKHLTFPPPTNQPFQYEHDIPAGHTGKGKERET